MTFFTILYIFYFQIKMGRQNSWFSPVFDWYQSPSCRWQNPLSTSAENCSRHFSFNDARVLLWENSKGIVMLCLDLLKSCINITSRLTQTCWANSHDDRPTLWQRFKLTLRAVRTWRESSPPRRYFPPKTKCWPNAGSMLGQRHGRWLSIEPALDQRSLFAGNGGQKNITYFNDVHRPECDHSLSVLAT